MKMLLAIAAVTFFSVAARADDHPCKKIQEACKAAGFHVKGHKETPPKGLHKDCIQPLLAGQTVAGVTVSADEIAACKAKKAAKK